MKKSLILIITLVCLPLGSLMAQDFQLSDQYDSQQHFQSVFSKAEMKYSSDKIGQFYSFEEWQTLFRQELKQTLGIITLEHQLNGFKPTARQLDSEDLGYAVRERWEIWTEPDVPLPVVILKPKNVKGKLPLMLTPHGHGKNTESYAGVYHSEQERAEGEEGERNVGVQAVQHGFIAIVPTTRAFGKTRTNEGKAKDESYSCRIQSFHDYLAGRTPIGDRVWDMMKIIDWALVNLSVDENKVIISGNSGGGTVSLFAGAIDKRIAITVPGSYFCTFKGSIGTLNHCDCNYVPGILNLGEMSDVAGLTAPRFFCALNGVKDNIFPITETRKAFAQLQGIYKAAGAEGNCSLYEGAEGHRYYKKGAWEFIDKHLAECNFTKEYKMEDNIGVCTSPAKAELLRQADVDYIEIGINGFLIPEKTDKEFAANLELVEKSCVGLYSGNGFFPGDLKLVGPDVNHARALYFAENAMRRALKTGVKIFVLGSGNARRIDEGFDRETAKQQFVTFCKALGDIADKYDVTVVLEPLRSQETNFINSVREGTAIAKAVNHPRIKVLADFFHMAAENEEPDAIVEAGELLCHCHIAEKSRHAPGHDGDDFSKYFKALKAINYKGRISLECSWEDSELPASIKEVKRQIKALK